MFSPDSKFMQVLSRICDLFLLNILFLITCLPIFTIGASLTALYTLSFKLMREEYSGLFKTYFKAFRDNFLQATGLWLLLLAIMVPSVYYFSLIWGLGGMLRYCGIPFVIIALLGLMTSSYLFPWISQFENTWLQALKNALILSLSRLPRTVCILLINLMPLIVLLISPDLFLRISFLWIALYFAAAAYANSGLLWHVFKPYRSE